MKLSEHFTLEELTTTTHETLAVDNLHEALEFQGSLTSLCTLILEPIRAYYGVPVTVSSGFRGDSLNKAVGGAKSSQHSYGEAADIEVEGIPTNILFNDIIGGKIAGLDMANVGQVIEERVGGSEWVHISLKSERYAEILKARYGSDDAVFLATTDRKTYELVGRA